MTLPAVDSRGPIMTFGKDVLFDPVAGIWMTPHTTMRTDEWAKQRLDPQTYTRVRLGLMMMPCLICQKDDAMVHAPICRNCYATAAGMPRSLKR